MTKPLLNLNDAKALAACPFCNAAPREHDGDIVVSHTVECFFTQQYAQEMWLTARRMKQWNTRAPQPKAMEGDTPETGSLVNYVRRDAYEHCQRELSEARAALQTVFCPWCQTSYSKGDDAYKSVLTHLETCLKHPIAERDKLKASLTAASQRVEIYESALNDILNAKDYVRGLGSSCRGHDMHMADDALKKAAAIAQTKTQ